MKLRTMDLDEDSSNSESSTEDCGEALSFINAILSNNYTQAGKILTDNPTLANYSVNGMTPLHAAIKQGIKMKKDKNVNADFIKMLLKYGAVDSENKKGETVKSVVQKRLKKHENDDYWNTVKKILDEHSSDSGQVRAQCSKDSPNIKVSKRPIDDSLDVSPKQSKPAPASYAVSGLKTSLHGTIYQLQLLMLMAFRGPEQHAYFDLATEMNQAEKFDDVVVKFRESRNERWKWRFIQAKHKMDVDRDKITVKDLVTETDGPFSIQKYFISFAKIKNNAMFRDAELEEFDLCTNTDFDFAENTKRKKDGDLTAAAQHHNALIQAWKDSLEIVDAKKDSLVYFSNSKMKKFKFNSSSIKTITLLFKNILMKSSLELDCLTGRGLILKYLHAIQIIHNEHDVKRNIEEIDKDLATIKASSKKEKGNITKLAKKISNLEDAFLKDNKYNHLKITSSAEKLKVNDPSYIQKRNEICDVWLEVLETVNDLLTQAQNTITACLDVNSPDGKAISLYLQELVTSRDNLVNIREAIWDCSDLAALKVLVHDLPDIETKLVEYEKKNIDIKVTQEKLWNLVDGSISKIVMLELTLNPDKFRTYLNKFLEKFRFLVCYPDVDKLNVLIKRELGDKFSFINLDLIASSFQDNILSWFKEYKDGQSEYLSKDLAERLLRSIQRKLESIMVSGLNKAYPSELQHRKIRFKEPVARDFLLSNESVLRIESKFTRLTSIKVLQDVNQCELYKSENSFIFLHVKTIQRRETRKLIVDTFSSQDSHHLLVLESDESVHFESEQFVDDLCRILKNTNKKLVIISTSSDVFADEFDVVQIMDQSGFDSLQDASQREMLNTNVKFQGRVIPLGNLIGTDSAKDIIDGFMLNRLTGTEIMEIGGENEFASIGYDAQYYISRNLRMQVIKRSVFKEKHCVFFVTFETIDDYINFPSGDNSMTKWHEDCDNTGIIYAPIGENSAVSNEIFRKICTKWPKDTIHWLHCNDSVLLWKNSLNNFINQRHIDEQESVTDKELYSEDKIIDMVSNKSVVVANGPGCGKSTFLTSMARKTKQLHEDWWIVRINLNDHAFDKQYLPSSDIRKYTRSLDELSTNITLAEAIDFVSEMVIYAHPQCPTVDFQRKLFKTGCQHNDRDIQLKLVLFFDGFDEISPTYKDETMTLLKRLISTDVAQVWVTTRISEKDSLQKEFLSLAYVLNPLSEQEQIQFLTQFWRQNITSEFKKAQTVSINDLDTNLKEMARNLECYAENEMTSIDDARECVAGWDFEIFATRLVKDWVRAVGNKHKTFTNNPLQLKMLAEIVFWEKFKLPGNMSLFELFSRFIKIKFDIYYFQKNILGLNVGSREVRDDHSESLRQKHYSIALEEVLPHTQDVTRQIDAQEEKKLTRVGLLVKVGYRLTFVHRTFAEFLLSEYVIKKLQEADIQRILFRHILLYEEFYLVVVFFDEQLQRGVDNVPFQESTAIVINEMISREGQDLFIHTLAVQGFTNTITFSLEFLKQNSDILRKVLLKTGKYGKIVLYDIIYNPLYKLGPKQQGKIVKTFLEGLINQDELLEDIFTKRHSDMFILLDNETANITILHVALFRDDPELLRCVMLSIRHNIPVWKNVLLKNGHDIMGNFLHFCTRFRLDKLMTVLELLVPDNNTNQFYESFVQELILAKDSNGRTPLHWASRFNHAPAYVNTFLTYLQGSFPGILWQLITTNDKKNMTALDVAIFFGTCEATIAFLNFVKQTFSVEQVQALLCQNGTTWGLLFKAIIAGKKKRVITLLEWFHNEYTQIELSDLLFERHYGDGRTSLSLAAARDYHETITSLLSWLKEHYEPANDDFFLNLFSLKNKEGRTAIHEAALWGNKSALTVLLDFLLRNNGCEGLASILLTTDKWGQTAIDQAKNKLCSSALMEAHECILMEVAASSQKSTVTEITIVFSESQLIVLENFITKHVQDNQPFFLDAVIRLRRIMNYSSEASMDATPSSIKLPTLPSA